MLPGLVQLLYLCFLFSSQSGPVPSASPAPCSAAGFKVLEQVCALQGGSRLRLSHRWLKTPSEAAQHSDGIENTSPCQRVCTGTGLFSKPGCILIVAASQSVAVAGDVLVWV